MDKPIMTLRDQFAAAALHAIATNHVPISDSGDAGLDPLFDAVARSAYRVADAMLAERAVDTPAPIALPHVPDAALEALQAAHAVADSPHRRGFWYGVKAGVLLGLGVDDVSTCEIDLDTGRIVPRSTDEGGEA